jgi:hypothetical protein
MVIRVCYFTYFVSAVLFVLSCDTGRPPPATPSLLDPPHLHHPLLPGQLCTAPPTTNNVVIRGLTTDLTILGRVQYFIGRGTLDCFPDGLHIPHSTETLTYAYTHTLVLDMLAFHSALKTDNRKHPPHMSLPATWWLLSMVR